jgi:hypothetical protein
MLTAEQDIPIGGRNMPKGFWPGRVKRHAVTQPLDASYRLIPLTQNLNAVVDAADYEWLSQWSWCASQSPWKKLFYAVRRVRKGENLTTASMHRLIFGGTCDHINRNGLDNRRANLRAATPAQQMQNQSLRSSNTSGFRGVSWQSRVGKWRASVHQNGKPIYLGYFTDKEQAAKIRDEAAKALYGEFAVLNFPETATQ